MPSAAYSETFGNYGCQVFDPGNKNENIGFFICDPCLIKKASSMIYYKDGVTKPASEYFLEWFNFLLKGASSNSYLEDVIPHFLAGAKEYNISLEPFLTHHIPEIRDAAKKHLGKEYDTSKF